MTDTFYTPEPDDTDPVAALWRMDNEARCGQGIAVGGLKET